ncbi:MAG: DUF4349 domain-containing protein, partial [Anaerolineae bacterium]
MKRTLFVSSLLIILLVAACAPLLAARPVPSPAEKMHPSYAEPAVGGAAPEMVESGPPAPLPPAASEKASDVVGVPYDASQPPVQERLVIKTAELAIVVSNPAVKMEEIQRMAEEMGGFVVSSNLYQTYLRGGGTVPEGSITVRVPAEKLHDALAQIKSNVVDVRSESISGQDVTADYVDLQSRLRNLEAAEARLTEIMEQAEKTEDVLAVFE